MSRWWYAPRGSTHGAQTMTESTPYGIDLLWIPLGAGGWFVRMNGCVWEAVQALHAHRYRWVGRLPARESRAACRAPECRNPLGGRRCGWPR